MAQLLVSMTSNIKLKLRLLPWKEIKFLRWSRSWNSSVRNVWREQSRKSLPLSTWSKIMKPGPAVIGMAFSMERFPLGPVVENLRRVGLVHPRQRR